MKLNLKRDRIDKVVSHRYFERFIKAGLFTRGFLYLMIGYLALSFDLYGKTKIVDMRGVVRTIYELPGGVYLVLIITLGLASLCIWGILRAIYDPYDKGNGVGGMMTRAGYVLGAVSYLIFCISSFSLSLELNKLSSDESVINPLLKLLLPPWGEWMGRITGGILITVSILQLRSAFKFSFLKEIEIASFKKFVKLFIILVGTIGLICRSIVYATVGYVFLWAASIVNDKNNIVGTEDALNLIYRLPEGKILLGLMALGLMMFGIYSLIAGWKLRYLDD